MSVVSEIKKNVPSNTDILTIGDRGKWPGNDAALLKEPLSLSVDEVSYSPETCWNLSPAGVRGVQATLLYLKKLNSVKLNGKVYMRYK